MFSKRIKELRTQAGLSQKELAKKLFIAQQSVGKWETGKNKPTPETVVKLAELFGVTTDYIMGHDGNSEAIRIPVLGTIPAGIPLEAVEDILDWEELPPSWGSGGREYFALRVRGDSMYPEYLDGDTVIVRKQPVCDNGDDCVVYVNGDDATLKRVKLGDDGSLTIQPLNPQYAPRTFSPQEIVDLPVSIAGVVVELRRTKKK